MPGAKKTATGAWPPTSRFWTTLPCKGNNRPTSSRGHSGLASDGQAEEHLYRRAGRRRVGTHRTGAHLVLAGGVVDGRLASSDPNLQNIPIRTEEGRKLRTCFIAEPGNVLISADYSQIELRLLADIGDIPQLKAAFKNGLDIHAMTASEMFGVPIEGMPSETRPPGQGDQLRHHLRHFRLRSRQPAIGIGRRRKPAPTSRNTSERFPGIRDLHGGDQGLCARAWLCDDPVRAKDPHPAIRGRTPAERSFGERAAINAPIQGAAADIIRRAMIRMPGALKEAGLSARMLLQVHDELVFEAPEAEAEAVMTLAKRVMERAAEPVVALHRSPHRRGPRREDWDEAH